MIFKKFFFFPPLFFPFLCTLCFILFTFHLSIYTQFVSQEMADKIEKNTLRYVSLFSDAVLSLIPYQAENDIQSIVIAQYFLFCILHLLIEIHNRSFLFPSFTYFFIRLFLLFIYFFDKQTTRYSDK